MRVETRSVEPDVVITLSHDEARQLQSVLGMGSDDFHARAQDKARRTRALRYAIFAALKEAGV